MRKTTIILLVLLAGCTWLAWAAFQPVLGRPNVSISLLGYTNETSGTRLAMIAVSNLGTSTIFVYRGCIGIPASAEFRGWTPAGNIIPWHSMLDGGAIATFTVLPPTNPSPWKLSFLVYNDYGAVQAVKRVMAAEGRHMPFEIESDWIGGKP
jgi:hypothetical protein